MSNEDIIDAKPRDIVEINEIPYYVVAELKKDDYDFVELSNLMDASIVFAAKSGDLIIPIVDEALILALASEMAVEAKENSQILIEAAKNAMKLLNKK